MPTETTIAAPTPSGCLLRLFWMFVGHGIVYASLAVVALEGTPFPSILDGVAWATAALIIVARRVDIARCDGQTATGEPATWAHWRRFSAAVVVATAAASLLAHAIGGG